MTSVLKKSRGLKEKKLKRREKEERGGREISVPKASKRKDVRETGKGNVHWRRVLDIVGQKLSHE